ncbi:MAG: hypothetical protein WCB18_03975 [Thermoplasmata archaeon]
MVRKAPTSLFPQVSPLPEAPPPTHVLKGTQPVLFDLSHLKIHPTLNLRVFQILALGAFVIGIGAVGLYAYLLYSGRALSSLDEFSDLLDVNIWAYLGAATGLFLFRMNRRPPTSLEVSTTGLAFGFPDGAHRLVRWEKVPGQTTLLENPQFEKRPLPPDMQLQLYTLPRFTLLWTLAFLPPRVPRTYLTREAFYGIIEGATRAGLTVTRFGDHYEIDQLNPMKFPSRF